MNDFVLGLFATVVVPGLTGFALFITGAWLLATYLRTRTPSDPGRRDLTRERLGERDGRPETPAAVWGTNAPAAPAPNHRPRGSGDKAQGSALPILARKTDPCDGGAT